jgi:hypothetical protein
LRSSRRTVIVLWLIALPMILVLVQQPATSAHFTLGKLTNSYRFHGQDFDPHVAGPTAFVWPGAGFAALTGSPSGMPPGYQPPWPDQNPQSAPSSWYQLEGNAYSPFGAILTSTASHANIGDLILGINFTRPDEIVPAGTDVFYSGMYIYIPPDFGNILPSQIVTSITNDYSQVSASIAPQNDPFAPGWIRISVTSSTLGFVMAFRASHNHDEWYYIRLNGVVAPQIAGKYFFKILLRMSGSLSFSYPASFNTPTIENLYMPVQNWPVLLVKGEVDPAILYGTIRYGAWNESLYGQPVPTSGMVRAIGRSIDPYTGQLLSRYLEARGYFNESAGGHYEVEGLAAGVYDAYASAAGFPERLIGSDIMVMRGQSMKLDGYLNPGPVVSGEVFSNSVSGQIPWTDLKPIRIEIYATNYNYTAGNLVSYSPANMTGGRPGVFTAGNVSGVSYSWEPGGPPTPTPVAMLWESGPSYYSRGACGGSPDPCSLADGVGPAQFWWVDPNSAFTNGGGPRGFRFQFGSKGVYGTPTNMSGYVPQALATWVNGLEPGRYYLRAFVNGYVQTTSNGENFEEYPFSVSANEWAGDIYVPMTLFATNVLNVTVHLHDIPGTLLPSPTKIPNSLLVELYDDNYNLVATNFTAIPLSASSASLLMSGFGLEGSNPNRRFSLYAYRGFGYQDYGISPGTYHMRTYVEGYLLKNGEIDVSLGLGVGVVSVSVNMYRGAAFQLTVYSMDWEYPSVPRNWKWPGERITIQVYNYTGYLIDTQPFLVFFSQPDGATSIGPITFDGNHAIIAQPGAEFLGLLGIRPTAYQNGSYTFKVLTYGYVQPTLTEAYGLEGNTTTDLRINLFLGVNMTLHIKFKSEGIFGTVPFNMSMRLRVFDDIGNLVGAWLTGSADDVLSFGQFEAGLSQNLANPVFLQSLDPIHRDPPMTWYVPGGTTDLRITISGIPPGYIDPIFSNTTVQGIKGSPFYEGPWTVEADTVNWYLPAASYPLVPALLQGESYHLIQSQPYPYGWTGGLLWPNHLGPYEQSNVWVVPNTRPNTEVSVVESLALNGYLQGEVLASDWSNEARTASWVRVQTSNENLSFTAYSLDGFFDMYLPAGTYSLTVTEWTSRSEGHIATTAVQIQVSPGQSVHAINFLLDESGVPIAEWPTTAPMAFALLGVLIFTSLRISSRRAAKKNTSGKQDSKSQAEWRAIER